MTSRMDVIKVTDKLGGIIEFCVGPSASVVLVERLFLGEILRLVEDLAEMAGVE